MRRPEKADSLKPRMDNNPVLLSRFGMTTLALLASLGLTACGPVSYYSPGPGEVVLPARETPGLGLGTAALPAEYPAYSDPRASNQAGVTSTRQQRIGVDGPSSLDNSVITDFDGSLSRPPLRGGDGLIYVLAGRMMHVFNDAGTEQNSFRLTQQPAGSYDLLWLEPGELLFVSRRGLECISPEGAERWTFAVGTGIQEFMLSAGQLRVLSTLGEGRTRLSALSAAGGVIWAQDLNYGQPEMQSGQRGETIVEQFQPVRVLVFDSEGELQYQLAVPHADSADIAQRADGGLDLTTYLEGIGGDDMLLIYRTALLRYSPSGVLQSEETLSESGPGAPGNGVYYTYDEANALHGLSSLAAEPRAGQRRSLSRYVPPPKEHDLGDGLLARWSEERLQVLKDDKLRWGFDVSAGGLVQGVFDPQGVLQLDGGNLHWVYDPTTQRLGRPSAAVLLPGSDQFSHPEAIDAEGRAFVRGWGLYRLSGDGDVRGSYPGGGPSAPRSFMLAEDGSLLAWSWTGLSEPSDAPAIYSLSADMQLQWRLVDDGDLVMAPSLAQDGSVLFFSEDFRSSDRIYVSSVSSAKETAGARTTSRPVADESRGWFGARLKCLSRDGSLRWSLPLSAPASGPALGGDDGLVYWIEGGSINEFGGYQETGAPWRLRSAELATGRERFTADLPYPAEAIVAQMSDGTLVLACGSPGGGSNQGDRQLELYAFDPSSGAERWHFSPAGEMFEQALADAAGHLYLLTSEIYTGSDPLYILDSDGHVLDKDETVEGTSGTPLLLGPRGELVVLGQDRLQVFEP